MAVGLPAAAVGAGRAAAAAVRERAALAGFGLVVALGFVYPFWMQPLLIRHLGNSGFIGMTVSVVPLSTILASAVLLRRRPTRRECVGVGAGLCAMQVLAGAGGVVGVGPATFALADLGAGRVRGVEHGDPGEPRGGEAGAADGGGVRGGRGVPRAPGGDRAGAVGGGHAGEPAGGRGAAWRWRVLGTGLATALFYRLIQDRGPLYAGMVTYVIPVEALLLGRLDGEAVSGLQVVALAVILASVAVVQWPVRHRTAEAARAGAIGGSSATGSHATRGTGRMTSWAIRALGRTSCPRGPRLISATITSPR